MKKIFFLLAFVSIIGAASAQKAVTFKIRFLPKHLYKLTYQTNMDMQMKLPDSIAKQAQMADGMAFKSTIFQGMHTTTGAKVADGSFPYEMKYDTVSAKMNINGMEKEMPAQMIKGTVISGQCTPEGRMHIDTIPNGTTNQATQNMVKEMVNKLVDEVKFPDKPLRVGESFTQEIPLALPMLGQASKISVKGTYKLTGIKGNLAYFDINIAMDMDLIKSNVGNAAMDIKGTGNGTGKMVYAIDQNFAVESNSDLNLQLDMQVNNMNMHINMKVVSIGKTEISAIN